MDFLLLNLIISLSFTSITSFLIGLFVLYKSKDNQIKRIFYLYSFSISLWSFWEILLVSAKNSQQALFYGHIMNFFIAFIPVLFIHLVMLLLEIKKKFLIRVVYLMGVIFSLLSLTNFSFFIKNVAPRSFVKFYVVPGGIIYHAFFLFFIISIIFGLYKLYMQYRSSSGVKRNQLAYLVWFSILGYLGGGANWFFVYNIYIPGLMPFGTYFVGIYVLSIAYAIMRFQLLDIQIVIKKAFLYSVGISIVSGFIVVISFLSDWFYKNVPWLKSWTVPLLAGATAFMLGRIFWNKSKEVDKLKYEFITIAAHKLRTPLTEVKWGIEALRDKTIDESERNELFSKIADANNRTIQLTDELLSVSKAENNQMQYKLKMTDLEKIAREVINDFQRRMKEKNIKLSYKYEKNLSLVNIDEIRIGSVIQTLLENAINYTKDEINIFIDTYKNNIIFHIEDNGIGVNKEDQARIFSKFYRSQEACLAETEGTGIGLFLAKSIIDRHSGKIGVRSNGSGQGSIFWFSLPAI